MRQPASCPGIQGLDPETTGLSEGQQRLAALEQQQLVQAIKDHWAAFESALRAEDLDEAAGILAQVRDLNPEAPGLAAGEQRLEAAQTELERKRQEALMRELTGEMVSIPGGTFRMGDLSGDGYKPQRPAHSVTVAAFKIGKYEVTFAQWDACVADGGCSRYRPSDSGWGRGNRPVMKVSWDDIQGFIAWLNDKTGGNFRLPTEAEWEYAARAGSTTKFHFGNSESQLCRYGNHADTSTDFDWRNKSCSDGVGKRTAAVGRYQPNSYGLYDMYGNVYEWVQDCWNKNYRESADRRQCLDKWGLQPARVSGRLLGRSSAAPAFRHAWREPPHVPLLRQWLPISPGSVGQRHYTRQSVQVFLPGFPFSLFSPAQSDGPHFLFFRRLHMHPTDTTLPQVIDDCHELLKWLIPLLDQFPRTRRFTLGERLESGLLAVLEECVDAAYSKHKRTQLSTANRRLSSVRHLWRLAYELRVIPRNRYFHGSQRLTDIGTQLGAWQKSQVAG